MVKSRSSAILSVALVFFSGVMVGAVANRLYMVGGVSGTKDIAPPLRPPERSPEEVRKHRIEEMRHDVKLDDQQVVQLEKIYDHTLDQFKDIHKRLDAEGRTVQDRQTESIKAMLRPDQLPLYEQLRAKHDAERKSRHKGDVDKGDRK